MALSADGSRLACSAGNRARVWDVASGDSLGRWEFPAGGSEALTFLPSGDLISFRAEHGPAPEGTWVCRLRNLSAGRPLESVPQFPAFSRHCFRAVASPGGQLVVEGACVTSAGPMRTIKCIDGADGKECWSIASGRTAMVSDLVLDSAGELAKQSERLKREVESFLDTVRAA